MYIVGEYLFIENFIINYILLQSTKIITRSKVRNIRIVCVAALISLYPFVIFLPSLRFLTKFHIKIIISLIIIKLAYNSRVLVSYLKQISTFYVLSFVFAGASVGFYYFTKDYYSIAIGNEQIGINFSIKYLILGVAFGGIMIKDMVSYYQEKLSREKELLKVTVYLNNQSTTFTALADTGNTLVEPLSKLPVFVVEYEIIKNILPQNMREIFENNKENDFSAIENAMITLEKITIRMIPFKSIGSNNGILIGFKPDYIVTYDNHDEILHDELLIGIFNNRLSSDNEYNGLLNIKILNRGDLNVSKN